MRSIFSSKRFSSGGSGLIEEKIKLVSFLGAVSLFLSAIDYMIPRPMPFIRLGLANLSVLLAIKLLEPGYVFVVILLKVLGQGLIQGTLFSYVFLFSFTGSFTSGLVMVLLYELAGRWITLIGLGIIGALASNVVQVILARFIVFGESAWYILPPFLIVGSISGFLLGAFAEVFWRRSKWVRYVKTKL